MKKIKLTNGGHTLVDESEYGHLSKFKWYKDSNGYALRSDKGRDTAPYYMHRWIMGEPRKLVIDHIDRDKLNNQLSNLRVCVQKNNSWNRSGWTGRKHSKYKGVTRDSRNLNAARSWIAYIMKDRKQYWLGRFVTEDEAALAYNKAARELHREFALLNEVG